MSSTIDQPRVVVIVGNPRPGSRTATAAQRVAERVAETIGAESVVHLAELAEIADELLAAEHPRADELRALVAGADVVVVATPVYKGAYTGLLKSFLDHFPGGHLRGVTAVPLVVSASPAHAVAGEVHLRPVLLEIGASVPVRSIALLEPQLTELDEALDPWFAEHAAVLLTARERALVGGAR
ncbi:MAG: NAD(P)H-dependent oxidoreductase [Actinomycetales bacterium]|jgi:FMN reductase|nr:NAD(P)H-dependent oxidoreductase [Actinomycetales bacterium]